MRELGLRDPIIEERDIDVIVSILHEPLASPQQKVLDYLESHTTIRNKKAREITYIKDADHMKRILIKMVENKLIERVPGTLGGGITYRKRLN